MRIETFGAAETQPVAPVGAAGGAIAAGAAGAVAADDAKTEPVAAAVSDGAGGGRLRSRRVSSSRDGHRRSSRSHRPWLIAALVAAVFVALTGVLIAVTNDPLPTRSTARQAAGEAAREAAQNALPPDTPVTFANAWAGLISAIGSAQATEAISDHAAEELLKDADELLGAYREGDTEKVAESLSHLEEELAKAVEEGEISPAAANAVDTAISDLVVALQNHGALSDVVSTGPTGETGGSGNEDKHGSPPHGEANGHDED